MYKSPTPRSFVLRWSNDINISQFTVLFVPKSICLPKTIYTNYTKLTREGDIMRIGYKTCLIINICHNRPSTM